MKLYNSFTKEVEEFRPVSDEIRIYSCGPTVYDGVHIGNLASFIYADTLRRVLVQTFPGHTVKHVMNLTDVDDKTIKRALTDYPDDDPKEALKKVTDNYTKRFFEDIESVGIDTKAIEFVSATDYIDQMQALTTELVANNYAYIADDGVYFSIENYQKSGKKYGQLSEITADSTSSSRIDNDEYDKDEAHDFALWKQAKAGEPSWEFKLNDHDLTGRPGWHIECSVMSVGNLGQPFDIHTGGVDLKFPHHENEIAQSTAIGTQGYANYFMHNEHLLVEGKKMSKSLNNFYTLKEITDRGFDPMAFRLLVLQGHYKSRTDFSWESLQSAQTRLNSLKNYAETRYQIAQEDYDQTELIDLISDDLHTPKLLAKLSSPEAKYSKAISKFLDSVLGLQLSDIQDLDETNLKLVKDRQIARDSKDFQKADEIRQELAKLKIDINDSSVGALWQRKY